MGKSKLDGDEDMESPPEKVMKTNASPGMPREATGPNPIGKLQELAAKRGWTSPVYEEVTSAKGFTVSCEFRGHNTSAEADGKKLAKREAASKMLANFMCDETENTPGSLLDDPIKPDVSKLQEYCQKTKLEISYSEKPKEEADQFIAMCKVGDNVVTGFGATKKLAKSDSAKKMIEKLKSNLNQKPS